MNEVLKTIAAKYKDDIVHTASELIQRNSQSLHEGEVAAYVQEKMKELRRMPTEDSCPYTSREPSRI